MTSDPTKISAQPPPEAPALETSGGENFFDVLAYGIVAGGVTFVAGVPLGYWARHGEGGKETVAWVAKHLEKVGMSEHAAADAVMTTALMQGGNLTLLPVKIMEDHKPEMVAAFNNMLGDPSGDCSVENEPKQNWMSLIKSRMLAWTAVFASLRGAAHLAGPERFEAFEKAFAEHAVCAPLGRPTHVNGQETLLFKLGRISAVDLFATAAAAGLLYVGSRFFAKETGEKWHHHTVTAAPAAPPPAPEPATETPGQNTDIHRRRQQPAGSYAELVSAPAGPGQISHS